MTETEWQTSTHPTGMLLFIREQVSDRKALLFHCACCCRVWTHLGTEDQRAIQQAEEIVDDPTAIQELERRLDPERKALLALAGLLNEPVDENMTQLLKNQTTIRTKLFGRSYAIAMVSFDAARLPTVDNREWEEKSQTELVREIFGNPFQPIFVDPSWLTQNVRDLAQTIYEERAFDRMPILADALMDIGCNEEAILDHCRSEQIHVRGCWVVDLLLGKN